MAIRHPLLILALVLVVVSLGGCAGAQRAGGPASIVVLVSIDGFRNDYLDPVLTPRLSRLASEGVRSGALIQVFPTKTFPTHYSIVTGLYPGEHGIIANTMYDPDRDAHFSLHRRDAVADPAWWGGEPVWNTAERQGVRAATFFWPGSEAPVGGRHASDWRSYDASIDYDSRVDTVIDWLARPPATRPRLVTLYFEGVDTAGHRQGLGSEGLRQALADVDRAVGRLQDGIEALGLAGRTQLLVVSDHGMAAVAPERRIHLFDYVDPARVRVHDWGPVAAVRPDPDYLDEAYRRLQSAHPHLRVFRREETPERWRFRDHPRIAPLVLVADLGWIVTRRDFLPRHPELATHGWDPEAPEMHGLLIAHGSAFRRGARTDRIEAIDLYELMCHLLGIEPAPNSGSLEPLRPLLR